MNEDFVTSDLAKKLKEKGFKEKRQKLVFGLFLFRIIRFSSEH